MICRLLGHKVRKDKAGRITYGRKQFEGTDAMGFDHHLIHADCARCGRSFSVIRIMTKSDKLP
jgi:hypothetical protein